MGNIAGVGIRQLLLKQDHKEEEDAIWVSHGWLLGEISLMIGCEEMLQTACNVCRAWRRWCNTEVRVLDVGNDFRILRISTIRATPLFLPLVPQNLLELSLFGEWTVPTPQELAMIRRSSRLRKLVMTDVRLFSSSYRELLLFNYLEELDISGSIVKIPFLPLRFAEPAGEEISARHSSSPELGAAVSDNWMWWEEGRGSFEHPRFARSLRKLYASMTSLWMRWDLATFPLLKVLEVSYASRALLPMLRRKAEMKSCLAELAVCDLGLRELIDTFDVKELIMAVGDASTFRLRRVDVGKEGISFPYLHKILSGLHNLQVLELTDVNPDDSMLNVLGGILFSASTRLPGNGGAGAVGEASLDVMASSIPRLHTLILGHFGGVSETALEKFLGLIGGGAGIRARVGRREDGSALSCVRLRGCKALGDRGLAALCRGTRGGVIEIEVSGSLLLTDRGVENLAKSCPRLTSVDISGCRGVTSNALFSLLAECPALRTVKALGVTVTGKPIRGVGLYGPTFVTPVASAAVTRALRGAYEKRKVDLVWVAPIPPEARGNYSNWSSSRASGGDGIVRGTLGDGDLNRCNQREPLGELSSNGWKPCKFGCGASLASHGVDDHFEVCPFAPVACLLRLYGCSWTGSRVDLRKHLKRCPMWSVKCPQCGETVHVAEFAEHVFSHSVSAEAPALRPPGCALRAYGCHACSTTNLVPTASYTSRNPSEGTAIVKGVSSGSVALNGRGREGEVGEKGHCKGRKKDNGEGDASGCFVHNIKKCPMYWLFCPSCEKEMSREEWDKGEHMCPPDVWEGRCLRLSPVGFEKGRAHLAYLARRSAAE